MSLLQKTIAELRELQHEEIDLVGGAAFCGPTGEPTTAPTYSVITTPHGPQTVNDDGQGDVYHDYIETCWQLG